jgi:DNA-binding NarL/FixJ family response regulator
MAAGYTNGRPWHNGNRKEAEMSTMIGADGPPIVDYARQEDDAARRLADRITHFIVFTVAGGEVQLIEEMHRAMHLEPSHQPILRPVVQQHRDWFATAVMEDGVLDRHVSHTTDALTTRERDVLRLLAQGLHDKEIADLLFISLRTVKFHAQSVYRKLGVTTRTQAVCVALQQRLIALSPPPLAHGSTAA